jgi:hypothetical protein
MRPQLLMAAVGMFMIGTMLCCIASGRWLLNGEINIFNTLASFNGMQVSAAGGWAVMKQLNTFINAISTALMWNYPFLDDPWCILVKFPLWIISIGVVWGFISVAMIAVQGVVGMVKNIIG